MPKHTIKILLIPDKYNWAFHRIAQAVKKWNSYSHINIDILSVKQDRGKIKKVYKKYDRILLMGYQTYKSVPFLPKHKIMTGVHSCKVWDEDQCVGECMVNPSQELISFLNKFLRVNVVSTRLLDIFRSNGCRNVFCTLNGVDVDLFKPPNRRKKNDVFFVGYAGTGSHDFSKGISDFALPAMKKAHAVPKLAILDRSKKKYVPYEKMPKFYRKLDCYLCASRSEGFSLGVLEAASTGMPVISTKISGSEDLILDGINGFLVNRTVDDISEKIDYLKNNREECVNMGLKMRQHIESNFCWSKRTNDWVDFLLI